MQDKDLVYLIALENRDWTEKYQKTSPGRYWDGCGGLCAIASSKLKHDLHQVGIDSTFVTNDHHCFLVVEDHIVDITATQFQKGFSKVTIIHKDNLLAKDQYFWKLKHKCKTFEEIRELMSEENWEDYQRPFPPGEEPT